ncbi:MAG TPA: maleylpyruvate isomerase N-terminal domain-containing protein, partial [Actinomycetes bacterium]|nr:maleylpyruvate isomerase N-terminal domain-containing protein [Actinomycetes bacterium]
MREIDYLQALRDEGTALVAAARLGLDPPVPACPGWAVADLVLHTGMVHRHKLEIVRGRLAEPPDPWPPPAPPRGELLGWYEQGLEELLTVLEVADPETRVWTFYRPDQTAGFWRRRMAQETAVHRVDAESAHGGPRPVPAALAADGVSELLEVFLAPNAEGEPVGGRGESLHLHATDTEGEWQLRLLPAGVEVERGHARGDAAAQGAASDLLLFL